MECSNLGKESEKGASLYGSVIENADYILDMEMKNQSKKRVRVDVDDSRWDKGYLSFLGDLEEYWEAMFEEEDDDDEDDPIYAMFLENVKEHGKGYMLDVSLEYGVCSPIMYEVEIDPSVLAQKRSLRTRRGSFTRKEGTLDVDRHLRSRTSGVKKYGFGNKVETDTVDVNKRESSRTRHGYNMRKRGSEGDGKPKSGAKNPASVCKVETDPIDGIEKSSGVNRKSKRGVKDSGFVNEDEGGRPKVIRRSSSRIRQDSNIRKKGDVHDERMSKSGGAVQDERVREPDETYKLFLGGTKVVGDSMVYEFGDHGQIFYEESVQQASTKVKVETASRQPSRATPTSTEPMTTPTPLSPSAINVRNTSVTDKAVDNNGKDAKEDHSELWRQLREILVKPFDENEFDELLKNMSSRSRVKVYRDSRSGGTYKPGREGKSYLDEYPG
ncbi:hypothetical protein RND81_02G088500 [Saponaria officinalis]|uniref:Uncharacterized protein n=1 Tax=Saponaria officinalis TaxID=3572 RepID=A0AAW1MKF6_SAPOF